MKIDNILVIGEPTGEQAPLALRKALNLAKAKPIAIHLLSVVYCESDEHHALLDDKTRHSLKERLVFQKHQENERLIASERIRAGSPGVDITSEVVWQANLFEAVRAVCRERAVDLIIKTGHRSESLLHIPTDFHLLHFSHIPVLIRRVHQWASKPLVLVKIEFSPDDPELMAMNHKVLQAAAAFARLRGAQLHGCHVIACSKVLMDLDLIQEEYLVDRFRRKYRDALIALGAEYNIGPGKLHVKAGPPEGAMASLANRLKADLVVIGAHHPPSRLESLLGSCDEKILSTLRTDVMTIKPD